MNKNKIIIPTILIQPLPATQGARTGLPSITGPLTPTRTQTGQQTLIRLPHLHISGTWEEIHLDMERMENAKTTHSGPGQEPPYFFFSPTL